MHVLIEISRPWAPALLCAWAIAAAQQTGPPEVARDGSELVTRDAPATFRTKVNVVLVPVIVRDGKGQAVGDLKKEDFQLFDRNKPQIITRFSVEKAGAKHIEIRDSSGSEVEQHAEEKSTEEHPTPVIADRFTAYIFDDVHLQFGDLAQARDAAGRHMASALQPTDRAAIFTSSGQTTLDFTDDRAQLEATLARLRVRPKLNSSLDCPSVSYYMGDLIQNKSDEQALRAATYEALECLSLDSSKIQIAQQAARSAASRALAEGETESRYALEILRKVVRRVSALPGQRNIVLISGGFITPYLHTELTDVIDAAIRSGVTINSIDARGLYTTGTTQDASQRGINVQSSVIKDQYERENALAESDVLAELANGTNGTFFHNNNDMNEAFRRTAAVPEYTYLLGFSPQNLKFDGAYHGLKVKLKEPNRLTLQARRGYFAPKHTADPAEDAKRELEEALFSRDVLHDIPAEIHTEFFKSSQFDAKLAVVARIDVKQLRFRKVDGRNRDDLTVVCGLFDTNGNFISAEEKKIEMRLKDGTLESRLGRGIAVRTSFDVKTGSYVIRLVVRDAEGQLMAAQNGSIQIP